MADLNDVLFNAIKTNTGDDIRPEVQPENDNELLKAMFHFMTIMLKRMTDSSEITKPVTEVVPFVS